MAGVVAAALGEVLRLPEPPALTVAGRTDAGVHARGQVVHADVPVAAWAATADRGADRAAARLARLLPADARARAIGPAPDGFDARFSALWRRYSYRVCDEEAAADPVRRHETLWYFRHLDVPAMNEAAATCLGEHDFAAFCRRRPGATTVRALRRLDWRRDEAGILVATVVADAFCHSMVRSLVGAMIAVGEGRLAARLADGAAGRRRPRSRGPGHGPARAVPRGSGLPAGRCARRAGRTSPPGADPDQRTRGQPLPVSIRVLRLMLALPRTRFVANCSSSCFCAEVDGDFRSGRPCSSGDLLVALQIISVANSAVSLV